MALGVKDGGTPSTMGGRRKKKAPAVQLATANSSGAGGMVPQAAPKSVAAQDAQTYNRNASSNIADDIARREAAAVGGFQADIAGMDLSGQFGDRGTTASPYATAQANLAAAGAAGVGQGGADAAMMAHQSPLRPTAATTAAQADKVSSATGGVDLSKKPGEGPSKVETAADQAADAIGPAPRVDMGLADRRLGEYQEALGMSREVIDRLLNGPSTAERLGSQVLRGQLALARSAAGGPGAVAGALRNAQASAPELQAQATEQARQEELQKLTAAGNVASNFAQAALGARGQDVNIAGKNVDAGLQVKDMISRLTGTQLELDQRNTELIGQMARDLAALQFDWASLTAQQASAALDRYMQIYGIDTNYRAQIKALEAQGKITGKDIFNGLIGLTGGALTLGAASMGKPPV